MGYKMDTIEPACTAAKKVLDLLGGFTDFKEDRAELQRHVKQVASALSFSNEAVSSIDDEEVHQALEGIQEALAGVYGALSELADKNLLVRMIMAGSLHEELQSNFNALQSNVAWLSAALAGCSCEGADLAHPLFVGLQATLGTVQLRVLKEFEQMAGRLADQIDVAVKNRLLAAGGSSRQAMASTFHNMAEQLKSIVHSTMGSDVVALLEDKQTLQEQTMQLQLSAQPLRSTKRDQEELLLAQLVSILSAEEEEEMANAAATAEPYDITICPITQEVMQDPVITASGHTYERAAITAWLRTHDTDPITNKRLAHKMLAPNLSLRKIIDEWQTKGTCSGMSSRQALSRQASTQLLEGGLEAFARTHSAASAALCMPAGPGTAVPMLRAMSAALPAVPPGPASATPSSPATPVALMSIATPTMSDKASPTGSNKASPTSSDQANAVAEPAAARPTTGAAGTVKLTLAAAPGTATAVNAGAELPERRSPPSELQVANTSVTPAAPVPALAPVMSARSPRPGLALNSHPVPPPTPNNIPSPVPTGLASGPAALSNGMSAARSAAMAAVRSSAAAGPSAAAPTTSAAAARPQAAYQGPPTSAAHPGHPSSAAHAAVGVSAARVPMRTAMRRRPPAIAPLPADAPTPSWPAPKWTNKTLPDPAASRGGSTGAPMLSARVSHELARAASLHSNSNMLLDSAPLPALKHARDHSAPLPPLLHVRQAASRLVAQNSNPVFEESPSLPAPPIKHHRSPLRTQKSMGALGSEIMPTPDIEAPPPLKRSNSVTERTKPQPPSPPTTPASLAPVATQELLRLLSVSSAPPATVNLLGSTVEIPAGQHLLISRPGVTLCNGVIELAADMQVQVRAKNVTLRDLKIHGKHFRFEVPGMLTTLCKGVVDITDQDALLQNCKVLMSDVPKHWEGQRISACVRVSNGGTARIEGCHLSGVSGAWPYGLFCAGRASVTVAGTVATACEHAFWAVQAGTQMNFQGDCSAIDNRWDGFRATDGGGIMIAGNCKAQECNVGFIALDKGSRLVIGEKCEANRNRSHGFEARKGATLTTGKGCLSTENGGVGFLAHEESTMQLGDSNQAVNNVCEGFKTRHSKFKTGMDCVADGNGKPKLESGHKGAGFCAEGACTMYVGARGLALSNAGHGFLAKGGAKLKLGPCCDGEQNGKKLLNAGFLSEIIEPLKD